MLKNILGLGEDRPRTLIFKTESMCSYGFLFYLKYAVLFKKNIEIQGTGLTHAFWFFFTFYLHLQVFWDIYAWILYLKDWFASIPFLPPTPAMSPTPSLRYSGRPCLRKVIWRRIEQNTWCPFLASACMYGCAHSQMCDEPCHIHITPHIKDMHLLFLLLCCMWLIAT